MTGQSAFNDLGSMRKRHRVQAISAPFKPRLSCHPLETPLPSGIGRPERSVNRILRDSYLSPMTVQKIAEAQRGVVNAAVRILFDLPNRPVPHTSEVPQPVVKLPLLPGS